MKLTLLNLKDLFQKESIAFYIVEHNFIKRIKLMLGKMKAVKRFRRNYRHKFRMRKNKEEELKRIYKG